MKTLIIILAFILAIILIAFSFSLFFRQEDQIRYKNCVLLQNPQTQQVDCYGCVGNNCKDAPLNWLPYEKPETGIPYSCFEGPSGCQLAQ